MVLIFFPVGSIARARASMSRHLNQIHSSFPVDPHLANRVTSFPVDPRLAEIKGGFPVGKLVEDSFHSTLSRVQPKNVMQKFLDWVFLV